MTQTVSIPAHHFIGDGKHPWLIIGRVPGDDDDSGYLVMADDEGQAQSVFVEALHGAADNDDDERADLKGRYGEDYIITTSQMLA
ncbi:MAG: hypothetical protein R3260_00125 [Pseudomonas sp.]|nr:hypothetical protein [Pseudomonas sp.]